jgi:hypothetical protein
MHNLKRAVSLIQIEDPVERQPSLMGVNLSPLKFDILLYYIFIIRENSVVALSFAHSRIFVVMYFRNDLFDLFFFGYLVVESTK